MRYADSSVRNIVFDLGGVLLNLSVQRTILRFAELSGRTPEAISHAVAQPAFIDYEKGLIDDINFRNAVRDVLQPDIPDDAIDDAWNAMLGDIPRHRLALLEKLRPHYRIFLLSNTNALHVRAFTQRLRHDHGLESLDQFFDRVYYSHHMKMRKPDVEIYDAVARDSQLNPAESLFLDDNQANVLGAQQAGWKSIQITHPDMIFTLFS